VKSFGLEADNGGIVIEGDKTSTTTDLYDSILKPYLSVLNNDNTLKLIKTILPHHGELTAALSTPGPQNRPKFTVQHENVFIEASGISGDAIVNGISKCFQIKKNFLTLSNNFIILIVLLISYHYKKKTVVKNIDVAEFLTLYLGMRIYKTVFGQFWPHYLPNQEVMAATIEGLDSNRFLIKKYKSVYKVIEYISKTHYSENFTDKLDKPLDRNIIYYFQNLYNRIHLMMKGIANAYYENHDKGIKTGSTTIQSEDGEGDTYLNDNESVSSLITSLSRKIFLKFMSDTVANPKFLKIACAATGMSASKMQMTVNSMLAAKESLIEEIVVKMLTVFFTNGGKEVKSAKFISTMVEVYSVSNTANDIIKEVKDLLDKIMKKYSKVYLQTANVNTQSRLKKTLFLYIVLYIVDNA